MAKKASKKGAMAKRATVLFAGAAAGVMTQRGIKALEGVDALQNATPGTVNIKKIGVKGAIALGTSAACLLTDMPEVQAASAAAAGAAINSIIDEIPTKPAGTQGIGYVEDYLNMYEGVNGPNDQYRPQIAGNYSDDQPVKIA